MIRHLPSRNAAHEAEVVVRLIYGQYWEKLTRKKSKEVYWALPAFVLASSAWPGQKMAKI